ncbi:conserved hypothetical protein [Pediculus humanus corporis]|uniref:Coiled-coil domain-containing protein 181 n=1 Tax=Pediculus humanus subsp. corporis TaxID=121224 RepID=E0VZM7_PEDHC|nr:uncharacterized protein Phum_PHUM536550 [Pediculus humanus corporis]EEB18832.1 conserved hypothetical protein [Pediculus humanus corporis]
MEENDLNNNNNDDDDDDDNDKGENCKNEKESINNYDIDDDNYDKDDEDEDDDDDDDCEGFFLIEPAGNGSINITEKIAEANKKLYEESDEEIINDRKHFRKVQFSDNLVNFEPDSNIDFIETTEDNYSTLEEDDKLIGISEDDYVGEDEDVSSQDVYEKIIENDLEIQNFIESDKKNDVVDEDVNDGDHDDDVEEEIKEEILNIENVNDDNLLDLYTSEKNKKTNNKLLILLPQKQNSSTESIVGEIITEEEEEESFNNNNNNQKKNDKKKMDDDECGKKKLNIVKIDEKYLNNIFEYKKCEKRPKSSVGRFGGMICKTTEKNNRPKTAPIKRNCYVIKTDLPVYNGLRSEYGLSAEQLIERKEKSKKIKEQKKQNKLNKENEERIKMYEREENFQSWLMKKKKTQNVKKTVKKINDTLTRSDVYIQTHASYATNRNVPYSIDYSYKKLLRNKKNPTTVVKSKKIISLDKIFNEIKPNLTLKCFNLYVGLNEK